MHHSLSNSQLRGVWEVRNVLSTDYTKPFLALLRVININGHITGTMVAGKQIRRSHLIDPTHHLLIFPEKLKRATPHKGVGKTKNKKAWGNPGPRQPRDTNLEAVFVPLPIQRFLSLEGRSRTWFKGLLWRDGTLSLKLSWERNWTVVSADENGGSFVHQGDSGSYYWYRLNSGGLSHPYGLDPVRIPISFIEAWKTLSSEPWPSCGLSVP